MLAVLRLGALAHRRGWGWGLEFRALPRSDTLGHVKRIRGKSNLRPFHPQTLDRKLRKLNPKRPPPAVAALPAVSWSLKGSEGDAAGRDTPETGSNEEQGQRKMGPKP